MKNISLLLLTILLIGCGGDGGGGGGGDATNGAAPLAQVSGATSVSTNGAILNGTVTPNGLSTDSWFEYGTDSSLTNHFNTTQQSIGSGMSGVSTSQQITGLSGNTTYYYRVCASNVKGVSDSSITSFTTSSPGAAPGVTTLAATSVGATTATLNGNVTANGLATSAWFEYGTDPSLTSPTSTSSQSVGSGTTSVGVNAALTGLTTGTTYYYRVAANNTSGTNRGSVLSFTPGAAPGVTTLAATSVGATTATLNGNATANGLATSAWFEYGTDPSLASPTSTSSQAIGSGTTSVGVNAAITGLTTGIMYYYRVAASNSSGTSKGNIQSFVPEAASTTISVKIVSPLSGALVGTTFDLVVSVTSTYQEKSVTVLIDGEREFPLAFSTGAYCHKVEPVCYPGWLATISLDGLAKGDHLMVITVVDVLGNKATASQVIRYDQKPVLSVSEPLNGTVARPAIHVKATCADDDPAGCESILAKVLPILGPGSTVIASGKDSLDQDISLATWDGTAQELCVTARDYGNQETTDCRTVYIESSSRLMEVATVGGSILDVSTDRILFLDGSALKTRDRLSGVETTILDPAYPGRAFLSPPGAIFVNIPGGDILISRILEWQNGVVTDLGHPNSAVSLKVAGKYAIWCNQPALYLRDLEAGTTSTVSTAAVNWKNDVTADGTVAWGGTDHQIRLGSSQITFGPEWNTYPLTDGKNVVYRKSLNNDPSEGDLATTLWDGVSEIILADPWVQDPIPQPEYRVAGGFVAYSKQGIGGAMQIDLRAPDGVTKQVSIWGTDSHLNALGPDGSLMFINQNSRYLDTPDNRVGSGLGTVIQVDGKWHVMLGRSLFQVN